MEADLEGLRYDVVVKTNMIPAIIAAVQPRTDEFRHRWKVRAANSTDPAAGCERNNFFQRIPEANEAGTDRTDDTGVRSIIKESTRST